MEKLLVSIPAASAALGLGRTSIYKLINDGNLETVLIGSRRLVRVESLRRVAGERGRV